MLNTNVLVLNRVYQPVHVTTVRRAFAMFYQGVVRAVDREYRTFDFASWSALAATIHDETVGTVRGRVRVPRVVLLVAYEHLPKTRVRFSRLNIYARDENTCQYCGQMFARYDLNLDHVIPRSRGGTTTWENVVCSCVPCNLQKGGRTPEEAGMHLRHRPVRPRWTPLLKLPAKRKPYRDWLPYLSLVDASYWNTELLED